MTTGGSPLLPPSLRGFRANRAWLTAVYERVEAVSAGLMLASRSRNGVEPRFRVVFEEGPSLRVTPGTASAVELGIAERVAACVNDAIHHASAGPNPLRWFAGSHNEGAWSRLHTAEQLLVELMPADRLAAYAPTAAHLVRRELSASDPRRVGVERIARAVARRPKTTLAEREREVIRAGLEAAYARNEEHYQRGRSVRNMTIAMAAFMFVLALGAVLVGWNSPRTLPMCLESDASTDQARAYVCPVRGGADPAPGDVALVAVFGMAGAGLSAARALSGVTKRLGPYSPVVAQGTLKIVMGALLAILGVTVLRAGWVPGVDDADSGSEILPWAVLFGYAQQVLTGLLDQRAENVLTRSTTETDGTGGEPPGADVVPDPEAEPPSGGTETSEGEATTSPTSSPDATATTTDGAAPNDATTSTTTSPEATASATDGSAPDGATDGAADPSAEGANLVPDAPEGGEAEAGTPEADAAEEPPPPPRKPRKRAPSAASGGSSRPSGRR